MVILYKQKKGTGGGASGSNAQQADYQSVFS